MVFNVMNLKVEMTMNNKGYLVPIKLALFSLVMCGLAVATKGVLWF